MADNSDEQIVYASGAPTSTPPDLRFLHYNDVYHVDASSAEPVGGLSRFQTMINYYRRDERFSGQPEVLTFFSGDAFNPSLESSVTKGRHMVPVLNQIGTDVACVGNHDLDFGVRQFRHLTSQCHFPWLLANVLDPALGPDIPLGNAKRTHMMTSSNGIKIGVIGLGEREWLETINSLPPNLICRSATETARELVPDLRAQGAEIVVAVTHQREPNDNKLAKEIGEEGLIDLILGGHDHYYGHTLIEGTHVLRSGTDFKQLSYIEGRRKTDGSGKWDLEIARRDITSSVPQDPETVELVDKLTRALKNKLEKPIGYTAAPLDARFTTVRTKESNLGNFVCDLMRFFYQADCCIMAAGTIRGDQIYPPGVLRLKDLMDCFPFEDPVVVIKVKGKAIVEALENGVSMHPALEGRFPQVSNIRFEVDYKRPIGSRILSTIIGDGPVELEREYVLATRGYMGRGKDGYTSLLIEEEGGSAIELVSEENGVLISTILRQYFMSLKVLGRWGMWGPSLSRQWGAVQQGVEKSHRVHEPLPPGSRTVEHVKKASLKASGRTSPGGNRPEGSETPLDESESEFEKDDDDAEHTAHSEDPQTTTNTSMRTAPTTQVSKREREQMLARKVMRKWWRLAKIDGSPNVADELGEGEFTINWTRAIAPRLEGRIKIVGLVAK